MTIYGIHICPHCILVGIGGLAVVGYLRIALARLFRRF